MVLFAIQFNEQIHSPNLIFLVVSCAINLMAASQGGVDEEKGLSDSTKTTWELAERSPRRSHDASSINWALSTINIHG